MKRILILAALLCSVLHAQVSVRLQNGSTVLRDNVSGRLTLKCDGTSLTCTMANNSVFTLGIGTGTLADPGLNGIVVRTAAGTTTARSLGVASPLTVSNADGTAGSPTLGMVNQGTTTTVLHGNAAGNPAFSSVGINDVSSSTGTGSFVFGTSPTLANPTITGSLHVAAGLVSAPAIAFPGNSFTDGFYQASAGNFQIVLNGSLQGQFLAGGNTFTLGGGGAFQVSGATGLVTEYAGVVTVGKGIPSFTGQSAPAAFSTTQTNLSIIASTVASQYRIGYTVYQSADGTGGVCGSNSTVTPAITYTDPNSQAHTFTAGAISLTPTAGAGTEGLNCAAATGSGGCEILRHVKTGTAITITYTYANGNCNTQPQATAKAYAEVVN